MSASRVLSVGAYANGRALFAGLKPLRQKGASSSTNDNSILVELPTFFVSPSLFKRIETFHSLFGID